MLKIIYIQRLTIQINNIQQINSFTASRSLSSTVLVLHYFEYIRRWLLQMALQSPFESKFIQNVILLADKDNLSNICSISRDHLSPSPSAAITSIVPLPYIHFFTYFVSCLIVILLFDSAFLSSTIQNSFNNNLPKFYTYICDDDGYALRRRQLIHNVFTIFNDGILVCSFLEEC